LQAGAGGAILDDVTKTLPRSVGPYRLEDKLGAGGMGVVYRATDTLLDRVVAIKMMHGADTLGDDVNLTEVGQRFLREAKAAARIKSRHVAQVLQLGTDDGDAYIVMEYLQGVALSRVIHKSGAMKPARVVHIAKQICKGMQAAHELGVVHRDLKPANVMLIEEDGDPDFVKILDFGVAKLTNDQGAQGLTQTGALLGTLPFMAPEQIGGKAVDARTDVYSLGIILYRMFTGMTVYDSDSLSEIVQHQLQTPAPSMFERVTNAEFTEAHDRIVLKCLAKDPAARWQSMRALADALDAVANGKPLPPLETGLESGVVTVVKKGIASDGALLDDPPTPGTAPPRRGATGTGGPVVDARAGNVDVDDDVTLHGGVFVNAASAVDAPSPTVAARPSLVPTVPLMATVPGPTAPTEAVVRAPSAPAAPRSHAGAVAAGVALVVVVGVVAGLVIARRDDPPVVVTPPPTSPTSPPPPTNPTTTTATTSTTNPTSTTSTSTSTSPTSGTTSLPTGTTAPPSTTSSTTTASSGPTTSSTSSGPTTPTGTTSSGTTSSTSAGTTTSPTGTSTSPTGTSTSPTSSTSSTTASSSTTAPSSSTTSSSATKPSTTEKPKTEPAKAKEPKTEPAQKPGFVRVRTKGDGT
jgi:serine/threonine protein kinase